MGDDVTPPPGNTYPAALVAVGATLVTLLIVRRKEVRERLTERLAYDPVEEAQRHARKALGIED
jgi:hypothetical protein